MVTVKKNQTQIQRSKIPDHQNKNPELVKIPCRPDEITLQMLMRAKMFKDHALSHASSPSEIDSMIAIHNLDNCIEYLLRISYQFLKIDTIENSSQNDSDLASLAGSINSFLKRYYDTCLPYLDQIKQIRQVRNLIQHGMVNPESDLKRFISLTNRFFIHISRMLFGLDENSISKVILISDKNISEHIKKAEKFLHSKEYLKSIVSSRDAFENALFFKMKKMDIKTSSIPALLKDKSNQYSYYFLEKITEELMYLRLNINFNNFKRFQEYLNYVPSKYNKYKDSYALLNRDWEEGDASFCLNYVVDEILKWQFSEMDDINPPHAWINRYKQNLILNGYNFGRGQDSYSYIFSKTNDEMILCYIEDDDFNDFNYIIEGKDYSYVTKNYDYDSLDYVSEQRIKILSYRKKGITNNPLRWEIMIWFTRIPFTYKSTKYQDDKVIEKPIDINHIKVDDLIKMNKYVFDLKIAKKIVKFISASKEIREPNDLKNIEGITEHQINFLAARTYIKT